MKLFLLKRLDDIGWDETVGLVIRAESATAAREIAGTKREVSAVGHWGQAYTYTDEPHAGGEGAESWLDPARTSCEEITVDGAPGVILRDFNAG